MTPTKQRDPDRLIRSFFEAGPTELSDRVFDAIVDDVHRHRQQAVIGPWRIPSMSRSALVAATAVAAVVLIAVVIGITHPFSNVGTEPTPTAMPSLGTPEANLGNPIGELSAGTYQTVAFSQPVTFDLPPEPAALADQPAVGDLWSGNHTLRIKLDVVSDIGGGVLTIHDDVTLPADLCDATQGVITDVPSSVGAIGTWLTSSPGLTVSAGTAIEVDGQPGMWWDISLPAACVDASPTGAVISFQAGEHHRVYAIPTNTDTMIAFTWGSDYGGAGEEKLSDTNAWADQVIASMRFN